MRGMCICADTAGDIWPTVIIAGNGGGGIDGVVDDARVEDPPLAFCLGIVKIIALREDAASLGRQPGSNILHNVTIVYNNIIGCSISIRVEHHPAELAAGVFRNHTVVEFKRGTIGLAAVVHLHTSVGRASIYLAV